MIGANDAQLIARYRALGNTSEIFGDYFRVEDTVQLETKKECLLGGYAMLTVASNGNFILADRMMTRSVFLFNVDGQFISKIGKPGEGPGEYRDPISVTTNPANNIFVFDHSLLRIQVYGDNGIFVNSVTINKYFDKMTIAKDGEFVFYTPIATRKEDKTRKSVFVYNGLGEEQRSFFDQPESYAPSAPVSGGGIAIDSANIIFCMSAYEYGLKAFTVEGDEVIVSSQMPAYFRTQKQFPNNHQKDLKALTKWYNSWTSIDGLSLYKQEIIVVRTSEIVDRKPVRRIDLISRSGKILKGGIRLPDPKWTYVFANENGLFVVCENTPDTQGQYDNPRILKFQLR